MWRPVPVTQGRPEPCRAALHHRHGRPDRHDDAPARCCVDTDGPGVRGAERRPARATRRCKRRRRLGSRPGGPAELGVGQASTAGRAEPLFSPPGTTALESASAPWAATHALPQRGALLCGASCRAKRGDRRQGVESVEITHRDHRLLRDGAAGGTPRTGGSAEARRLRRHRRREEHLVDRRRGKSPWCSPPRAPSPTQ
jgi:hypothetical protein